MAINANGQNALPSFLTKWQTLAPVATQYTPQAQSAVFGMDLRRLQTGQQTLSQNEALLGLGAAQSQQTSLPSPHDDSILGLIKHLPSAAVSDLSNVLTNIPHIPAQLAKTVTELPQVPGDVSKALADHSIGELAKTPGINLIPGSYLAQNLSHPTEILKHPVMSALDVMPYAAEGLGVVPDEYKAALTKPVADFADRFGLGPVSSETARAVNVAQRGALDAAQTVVQKAYELTKDLSPEDKQLMRSALMAEPADAKILGGQLQLPVTAGTGELPPELMDKFNQLKDGQQKLNELHQAVRQTAANTVANSLGKTAEQLMADHGSQFNGLVQRGINPADAMKVVAGQNGLEEWNPGKFVPGAKYEGEPLWVPKAANDVLKRMFDTRLQTGFGKAYDTAMRAFRTAVLPLSLHWQTVHATGLTAMILADTGPSALAKIGDAWDMVKRGDLPHEISQAGQIGGEHGLLLAPKNADDVFDIRRGAEIHKMLNSSTFEDYARKLGKPLAAVIDKSYRVSNIIDHMGGAVAYLYAHDKSLEGGLTEEESHAAGIAQANKVLHDWDGVTPVERSVVRSVFPFYPWMKTITKYLAKYPLEHPLRTSIVSNFAQNELADQKTGIPDEYKNYFLLGRPDKSGNQKSLYINRINPFSDVSSLFTLGGLLSQTNPFVGGIAQAIGINSQTGAGQAFPQVKYNSLTGKQEAVHQNPLTSIAENFIPQETALRRIFGLESKDVKNLKQTNPDTYANMFWSSIGVPNLRNVNLPQIAAQAEVQKFQALSVNVNSLIKSGDFSALTQYGDQPIPFSGGGKVQLIPATQLANYLEQLKSLGLLNQLDTQKNGLQNLNPTRVMGALGIGV